MTRKLRFATFVLCGALPLGALAVDYGTPTGSGPQQSGTPSQSPSGAMGSPGSSREGATATERGAADTMSQETVPGQFKDLDKNLDGQISKSEARKSADLKAHFKEIDTDKNGKISLSEWQAGQDKLGQPSGAAGSKGAEKEKGSATGRSGTQSGPGTGSPGGM